MSESTLKLGKVVIMGTIQKGDAVWIKGTRIRAKIAHLWGKGTHTDPHCALIKIPAQTIPVRLDRVEGKDEADG